MEHTSLITIDFNKKPLIILTGPTAVGKTSLSLRLAHAINGSIISADSMQVYQGMDIGTAKIMPEERDGIAHYLIDILRPDEEFHVVGFQQYAKQAIEDCYANKRIPILTGGTGFYIQSVLYDIQFGEEETNEIRLELEQMARDKGVTYMHHLLEEVDSESASKIHPNNCKRVIRALEFYRLYHKPISQHNEEERQRCSPYQFLYFVLDMNRSKLYDRINQRVDSMLNDGLVQEVKMLQEKGYHKGLVSMQGLGYKEILDYLNDECSLEEAIYTLKRDTRHFAKRQLTWFRREKDVVWMEKDDFAGEEDILQAMLKHIEEKFR